MKTEQKTIQLLKNARVIGFDPGLAATGWAVVEYQSNLQQPRHIAHGVIRTDPDAPIQDRIAAVNREVKEIFKDTYEYVEEAYCHIHVCAESYQNYGRVFWNGVQTLYTMGALFTQAEYYGYRVHLISAKESKRLIGVTDGKKTTVQTVVQTLLELPKPPKPTHAADALCIALAHLEQIYPGTVSGYGAGLPGKGNAA